MKSPLLSVIIPIYNSQQTLARCIESVINQDFEDFELILVNDGSIDQSLEVCYAYSQKDSRIKIINKLNEGVSSARNIGLLETSGEWITFIDSDDWIYPDTFSAMIDFSRDVDLVVGAMCFGNSGSVLSLYDTNKVLEGENLSYAIQSNIDHHSFNSPCAKLFLRTIIKERDLHFDESLCFGEDALFVKDYMLSVKRLKIVSAVCYHYCDHGVDIYRKYSKNFAPIYRYYKKMQIMFKNLSSEFAITINDRELVGVVFNIALQNIVRNGIGNIIDLKSFLTDPKVCTILKNRRSYYLNMIMLLARLPIGYSLVYFVRLIERLKSLIK